MYTSAWLSIGRGKVSVKPGPRQPRQITSAQVFLGWPRRRPTARLSLGTFISQPSLRSTWPCHLTRRVWSTRLSSNIISRRPCELTWSFAQPMDHWFTSDADQMKLRPRFHLLCMIFRYWIQRTKPHWIKWCYWIFSQAYMKHSNCTCLTSWDDCESFWPL